MMVGTAAWKDEKSKHPLRYMRKLFGGKQRNYLSVAEWWKIG